IYELDAFKAALDTGVLAGRVFDGDPEGDWYVSVIPGRNADEQDRHTGPDATEVLQFTVRSVGDTLERAVWVDEQVDSRLRPNRVGITLDVPGRSCGRIQRRASTAP